MLELSIGAPMHAGRSDSDTSPITTLGAADPLMMTVTDR